MKGGTIDIPQNIFYLPAMDEKQAYFDRIGHIWDTEHTAEDLERLSHIIDSLQLADGWKICDLGCGTGVLFDILRRKVGKSGCIAGVDFAPQVAQQARRNFPFKNIDLVIADAASLPFASGIFDIVVSFAAFPHFSKKDRVIKESHRILRSGGRLAIVHLTGSRELAMIHHHAGGPVENDHLPERKQMEEIFRKGDFVNVELTDTDNLYMAIGQKR